MAKKAVWVRGCAICGDRGKMEPDIKAALVRIYRERRGADAAQRRIDDLGAKNRYVLDV